MIRQELKSDPIGFISKHLEGVYLNRIEQLYIISKCPHLFEFINEPSKLVQRIYVRKTNSNNISISNIRDRKAFIKALKKKPSLCTSIDIVEYEKEVSMCIDLLYAESNMSALKDLISDDNITNGLLRKIIFLVPMLVEHAIDTGIETFDEDIELFIYVNNPMLINTFVNLSKNTVEHMIKDDLSNIKYVRRWLSLVSDELLLDIIEKNLLKRPRINSTTNSKFTSIQTVIKSRPYLFSDIIKILYKNGFNKKTDFILRFLLKEYNELIDDQIANFIIEMEEV